MSDDVLKELKKISKIMTLSNGKALETEIAKYASTNDRKKIWVLIDGKKQSDEIAKIIGVTKRAVDIFLKILEDATLVEREFNKPPTRILDYVPVDWIELLQKDSKPSEEPQTQTSTQPSNQSSQEATPNV